MHERARELFGAELRRGMTAAPRQLAAVAFVVIIGLLVGKLLVGVIGPGFQDMVNWLLGIGGPFDASAANSAKAMSYATSCSALIHSYAQCSSVGGSGWQQTACTEMASNWNNDAIPRSDKVNKPCKMAVEGNGAGFGNVRVVCTGLKSGAGSAAGSAGCTVHGFTLPQEFGDDVIADAKQFLLGHGAPKYMLYYEAYDSSYTAEWEQRLTSTSYTALVTGAAFQGLMGAVLVGGLAVPAKGARSLSSVFAKLPGGTSAMRGLVDTIFSSIKSAPRRMNEALRDHLPDRLVPSIPTWDDLPIGRKTADGEQRTMRDAIDDIAEELKFRLGKVKRGLPSLPGILRSSTDEAADINYRLNLRSAIRQAEADRLQPGQAISSDIIDSRTDDLWRGVPDDDVPGLKSLYEEGADGRTLREVLEDGETQEAREAVADRISSVRAARGEPPLPASEQEDLVDNLVGSTKTAIDGEEQAVELGMSKSAYWKLAASNSADAENLLEVAAKSDEPVEAVARRLEDMKGSGDEVLKRLDEGELEDAVDRSGSVLCGSKPARRFAAYIATTAVADRVVDTDSENVRAAVATIPAAGEISGNMMQEMSSACGSGRNPLAVVKGVGGVAGAYAMASLLVGNAREVRARVPKIPQGTNSLMLVRGDLHSAPRPYPMNKYANWWFMNLDPKEAEVEPIGGGPSIDPPGRRFMVASPCYGDRGKKAKLTIRRDTIDAMLDSTSTGIASIFTGAGAGIKREDAGPGGLEEVKQQEWSAKTQGSYRRTWGISFAGISNEETWIMYTSQPVVHPVPAKDMAPHPPGQTGFDNMVTVRGVSDDTFSPVRNAPGLSGGSVPYFDQRGWWYRESGQWKRYVPQRKITASGIGAKTVNRESLSSFFTNDILRPFSKEKSYQLSALTVTFKNTELGSTDKGPNYCYSRRDWDADLAKASGLVLAVGAEIVLDAADIVSLGSGYAVTGVVEFVIGSAEYLWMHAAGEMLGDRWPH